MPLSHERIGRPLVKVAGVLAAGGRTASVFGVLPTASLSSHWSLPKLDGFERSCWFAVGFPAMLIRDWRKALELAGRSEIQPKRNRDDGPARRSTPLARKEVQRWPTREVGAVRGVRGRSTLRAEGST